jgi:hypothetical protein
LAASLPNLADVSDRAKAFEERAVSPQNRYHRRKNADAREERRPFLQARARKRLAKARIQASATGTVERAHDNPELCTALQRAHRPFAAAEIGFDETLDDVATVRLRPLLSGGPPAVAFHVSVRLQATSDRETEG